MGNKTLSGCGIAILLLLLIVVIVVVSFFVLAPKIVRWIEEETAKEQAWQEFALAWRPPPDNPGADWIFPAKVGEFQLVGYDKGATVPEFGIDIVPAHHAIYRTEQQEIEVNVYRVNKLEKEALYRRIGRSIEEGKYNNKITSCSPEYDRCEYTVAPPRQKGSLWWSRDWLFYFRTNQNDNLEPFIKLYLNAIQNKK